jgi:hypothetical protein
MYGRENDLKRATQLLRQFPVVGLLGPRQVGKTTLASAIAGKVAGPVHRFDLESSADLARLTDPLLALEPLRGLVVLDEIQRVPEIFPALRVLADRPKHPAKFLVLGSAAPELLRQTSETLAGRVSYHQVTPFSVHDVEPAHVQKLWRRGGFPRAFLARSEAASSEWRRAFVGTFLERDIPSLGFRTPSATLERFWSMLAHYHAQTWNGSEIGRAFGVSDTTVRSYLEMLAATFMVRILPPWFENIGKRQVKAPKVYISDSGVLHTLLGIESAAGLERHPKVGASFEGFALSQVSAVLGARPEECFFWATHQGAELDLLVVRGRKKHGFEFKRTSSPKVTPSMHIALKDLGLHSLTVVHAGKHTFPLEKRIRAVALEHVLSEIKPLS